MKRVVIALGGNALGNTPEEQMDRVKITAKVIVEILRAGNQIVVCHGNGPQVGMINLAFEKGAELGKVPPMSLSECIAMSQGYIGYHLQQAIDQAINDAKIENTVVITMLTQVVVNKNDPAFKNPTKPIGSYYDEATAKILMNETGSPYREDSGRGWRMVVPSPSPVSIYEKISLNTLINANHVVIAGGGGGIPVVMENGSYHGIPAVVDKDLAAEKLAELVHADILLILTAVEKVAVHFGKPEQRFLDTMTIKEGELYIREGHFAPGSMLPKVTAALRFAATGKNKQAIICSLDQATNALNGITGTLITQQ